MYRRTPLTSCKQMRRQANYLPSSYHNLNYSSFVLLLLFCCLFFCLAIFQPNSIQFDRSKPTKKQQRFRSRIRPVQLAHQQIDLMEQRRAAEAAAASQCSEVAMSSVEIPFTVSVQCGRSSLNGKLNEAITYRLLATMSSFSELI